MSEPTSKVSAASESINPVDAIQQLRSLVLGLGVIVLVLSVGFSLYVWKQNRNITSASNGRKEQVRLLQTRLNDTTRLANDLANYSANRPELIAIFTRYGMELKPRSETPATGDAAKP